jgi:hypothetical protein
VDERPRGVDRDGESMFSAEQTPAVSIPITRPCRSVSGPPELPGLIAAEVCSTAR